MNAFSHTTRSLARESTRGWTIGITLGAVLLCAWSLWFVLGRVPLYETSQDARLESASIVHPITAPADVLLTAAARRKTPLALRRIRERDLAPIYAAPAVLVRPDQHVAWRGTLPRDAGAAARIVDRALGRDVR